VEARLRSLSVGAVATARDEQRGKYRAF